MKKTIEQIKEENKSLIALRNNYFTMIIVVSSGLASLFFAAASFYKLFLLTITGTYIDIVFILKFQNAIDEINRNIKEMNK